MWTSFIGFMASGKSTVTRRLQTTSNRPVVSVDQLVAERAGLPVRRIFAEQGAPAFRAMELAALESLELDRPLVVDTGGGVVETPAAVERLRQGGVVIWLDAPWETLRGRLKGSDRASRPLIDRLGWAGLEELFHHRRRLYAAAADFRLRADRGTSDEIARTAMLRSLQWARNREQAVR